ncbi:MAG: hypothetical protein P1U30_00885 [Phycisphaerales bacterium]|nr:hypothetical protein [Phycisphaerales bacterium]
MDKWKLQCIDKKTGEPTDRIFNAVDQKHAVEQAHELGFVVGALELVQAPPPKQEVLPTKAVKQITELTKKPTSDETLLRSVQSVGLALILFAVIGGISCAFMDTSYDGMHNIGLINNRTVGALYSIGTLITGAMLFSCSVVGFAIIKNKAQSEE